MQDDSAMNSFISYRKNGVKHRKDLCALGLFNVLKPILFYVVFTSSFILELWAFGTIVSTFL